jgi:hypothetical protein
MAITINQQATSPGASHGYLLYGVSSGLYNSPQYQYVMDVVSGSTVLTTVRQFPNPANAAIFDPARIINDYLSYPNDIFDSTDTVGFGPSLQTFTLKFGEEYASSYSASVVLYDGNGNPGRPAVASNAIQVFPAAVDPNNGYGYNWTDTYSAQTFLTNHVLYPDSQYNYKPVGRNDYGLIGYYGNSTAINVIVYDAGNNVLDTVSYGGDTGFYYIPVGGKNLRGAGLSQSDLDNASYFVVNVVYAGGNRNLYYTFDDQDCHYQRTNFLYINRFGAWDHYGVTLPLKKSTSIKRDMVVKSFVDYSGTTSVYNNRRRSMDTYATALQDNFSITTNWLNQDQALWLSELIESPQVFIQDGTKFIPVNITSADYVHNTNSRSQKAFSYEIQYTLSNQRPGLS